VKARRHLPSREEAISLLKAAGCPPEVVRHSERVAKVAVRIARACARAGLSVDLALVEAGALLHDIGRAKTHSIAHVFIGAEMAREFGLPEELVEVILRHTGGLRPEVAKAFGWPPGDYAPRTLEEKIVAYADKLVEGRHVLSFEVALARLARELGPDHPAVANLARIHEELSRVLGGPRLAANPRGRA